MWASVNRQGHVTRAMLATPKPLFVLTGMFEAAAQLLMMTGNLVSLIFLANLLPSLAFSEATLCITRLHIS